MTDTLTRPEVDEDEDYWDDVEFYCGDCDSYSCYCEPEPDGLAPWERPWFGGDYTNEYGAIALNKQTYIYVNAIFTECAPFVHLTDFRIHDEHQGKGHGRRMLQTVIDNTAGMDLTLEVYAHNTPAFRLYESLGFIVTKAGYITSMRRAHE